jgi:peptidylprolyl isomerase
MLRKNVRRADGGIMPDEVKNGDSVRAARDGDTVRVHYSGRLESGDVFDESAGSDPLEFEVGAGQVIPGFDEGVRGMRVGDERRVEIEAEDAYGPREERLVNRIAREGMRLDADPEVGMSLLMQLPDGNQIPLTITEVSDTHVTVDANHPLAGEKLIFDIKLVEIKEAR